MSSKSLSILSQHPVLKSLTPTQISALEECASLVDFPTGERLLEQGKQADRFYLIHTGKVAIEVYSPERGPKQIQQISAGELLGSSWLVEPHRWQFDARTIAPTQALVFNARCVQDTCANDPELSAAVLKCFFVALANRLNAAQKQILSLYAARP